MKEEGFLWDLILQNEIATEAELRLVTCINGYNAETLWDIIEVRTGVRSLEQLESECCHIPSVA